LCPSNENKMSEKYNDLLGVTSTSLTANQSCGSNPDGSKQGLRPDGTTLVNPGRIITGNWTGTWAATWNGTTYTYTGGSPLAAGTDRTALVENVIWKQNYNTNYASSWFMVRGGVSLNKDGQLVDGPSGCTTAKSNKERFCTRGPLKRSNAE